MIIMLTIFPAGKKESDGHDDNDNDMVQKA